jgi:cytochrome b6-f complex iron-sulfur subunit
MDRKEFLSLIGIGAVGIACSYCLTGCSPQDSITAPTNVNFTLDLTAASNAPLKTVGGYIYANGIIVTRLEDGSYDALSQTCTHQGGTVYYNPASNIFVCPVHGSEFSTGGAVVNGPATSPLAKYKTSLSGNSLRVYS